MAFTLKNVAHKTIFNPKKEEKKNQKKITCQISKFIYKDEESGFFVFLGVLNENEANVSEIINGKPFNARKFAVVGNSLLMVQSIVEGQEVEVWGSFEAGKMPDSVQFTANAIQECIPTKPKAIELFLASGKITGIGPKTAKKIVTKYGPKVIEILDKNPEHLLDIEGVTIKKLEGIKSSWQEWRAIYDIVATMRVYGVGDVAGVKIYNHFKEKSIYVIKNEPYSLTEVDSIGFKTADKIAQSIGISPVDENRIEKCILYTMEEISEKGHTAYPKEDLIEKVNDFLSVDPELIKQKIQTLIEKEDLIEKTVKIKVNNKNDKETYFAEYEGVAHKKIHNAEARIAKEIVRVFNYPSLTNEGENVKRVADFLVDNPNKLDESQLNAAKNILTNKVSVLTGGPGTGKTHTIKALLDFFEMKEKKNVQIITAPMETVLSAPTGRASKRMQEATGRVGSTIHRLLGYKEGGFFHNETNKLSGDVFIVDESSMIDIWLAAAFLKAVPDHAIIIFVGDIDQLPSVGAGNFLRDLIESAKIPVSRLGVIHRQALNSNIIVASHDIIHRKVPKLYDINSDSDFVFVEKEENEDIHSEIIDIIANMVSSGINPNDIQVLTPKKETEVGTNSLNSSLRPILNPIYMNYTDSNTKFVPGDRVMQYKNNKELDIFNGDVGFVKKVDVETGFVDVDFDDRIIDLTSKDTKELNLSYAITIHKSQGSDYPYVIVPMSKSHTFMWDANLLYTAVTRGKKRVIMVGDKKTLFFSVAQFKQSQRITGLKDLIINEFDSYVEDKPRKNNKVY